MLQLLVLSLIFSFVKAGVGDPKCLPGAVPFPDKGNQTVCHLFVNESLPFFEAEAYCRRQRGHLVTINDTFTDMYLAVRAREHFSTASSYWTGARVISYSNSNIWVWTRFNGVIQYSNWKDSADSGTSPKVGSCAAVTIDDLTWAPVSCTAAMQFVCQVPRFVSICDDGYTHFTETDKCYKLISQESNLKDFSQAEAQCNDDGGHLVSIHSDEENAFVSSLAPGRYTSNSNLVWIGLVSDSNLRYSWTDGTPFEYHNWFNAHSADACTCLYSDGLGDGSAKMTWDDFPCNWKLGRAICEKQPVYAPYYSE